MGMNTLDTPFCIVDMSIAMLNVREIIDSLSKEGIAHRPHIKAHKSSKLAKMQLEMGAIGITCAKVSEAEAMLRAGVKTSIFVANEVIGAGKCDRLMSLAKQTEILSCVDSAAGAGYLNAAAERAGQTARVCLEVDIGMHRCGVNLKDLPELCHTVSALPFLEVVGVMGYSALAYGKQPGEEMRSASKGETDILLEAKSIIEQIYHKPLEVISCGSSYSSRYPETLRGITESRAGNYIFNDAVTVKSGCLGADRCSFYVVATIISIPERGRLLADAGSKTLSSDGNHYDKTFGYVIEYPEMEIYKLNEEHAYIRYPETDRLRIGDRIRIIPNHSCVVPNLVGEMYGLNGNGSLERLPVEARGAIH